MINISALNRKPKKILSEECKTLKGFICFILGPTVDEIESMSL